MMMKLLLQPSNSWGKYTYMIRVLELYPTRTLTTSSDKGKKYTSLYTRLDPVRDPKISIVPILDQWVEEGGCIQQSELQKFIKQFRKYKRFEHALQISEWMSDKKYLDLSYSPGDVAVHLDLIAKVHGVEQAEEYFKNIPNISKGIQVYGSLLNFYVHAKLLEKAEFTMQKIREMGNSSTFPYNLMLNLYHQMGVHEKLSSLMQEMEEKGINFDIITYNTRLNAYVAAFDIEGTEKLLMKMEADPHITMNWSTYAVVANGYIRAGLTDKALVVLKKSEQLIRAKSRRIGYQYLLTLYANIGNKDEVYRIWNSYKNDEQIYNLTYLCMISALEKLDDLDGAEKILEEWKAKYRTFDFRVPDLLVTAYCKKGLMRKAETIVQRLIDNGKEPTASTWSRMALGYSKANQMEKAVETLKKGILLSTPWCKPTLSTLVSCLGYLKGKGDLDMAEQIISLLQKQGLNYRDVYDRLDEYMERRVNRFKAFDQAESDDQVFEVGMLESSNKVKALAE